MYTQNIGLITATLAAWAIAATILSKVFDDNFNNIFIIALIFVLLVFPAVVAIPLSIKSGDNLTRVAQLASYIRIFHELPSRIHTKDYPDGILMHESTLSPLQPKKSLKFFNIEFVAIVILSMLAVVSFFIFLFVVKAKLVYTIICGLFAIIAEILALYVVLKNSSVRKNFIEVQKECDKTNLHHAQDCGIIKPSELEFISKINID